MNPDLIKARAFLAGLQLAFAEAKKLWDDLRDANEISVARAVLAHMREPGSLVEKVPVMASGLRDELVRAEAELTSKDPELSAATRHDTALALLDERFGLTDSRHDGNAELLGTAGGIYKRRWQDLGRIEDLKTAAGLYERGARGGLGGDAYAQINAAFLDDLLAAYGFEPLTRRERARVIRERIINELPADTKSWWNTASRAEALLGLRRYAEATEVLKGAADVRPATWKLQTSVRQLGHLAQLLEKDPLAVPALRDFFQALLPGEPAAACSAVIGKVGLALSGGGFRASFYHLGVLARLAEADALRHVEVLSCVSGGSIVGACYWIALRRRSKEGQLRSRADYVALVKGVIAQFQASVAGNLRAQTQPGRVEAVWRALKDDRRGAMDPERAAKALDKHFYRANPDSDEVPLRMDHLPFTPADHAESPVGTEPFHPTRHNWLRENKVPVLVINASTVNTGHGWQFTPHWMGESPWNSYEGADSVARLEWAYYDASSRWQIELGRAVAASACVPFIFAPLELTQEWERDLRVQLVDGGVYDNQGTTALLAHNCSVVLVSDACGQLRLQERPAAGIAGLGSYAMRSMDTLMERVRLANYSDLEARRRSGLLRGLMFLHMKAGLSADTIRRKASQTSVHLKRDTLTPSGVRHELQQAIAELRTDLDAFTDNEANALMACGYQMAGHAMKRDLAGLPGLLSAPQEEEWPFGAMLRELTSLEEVSRFRDQLLRELREGSTVRL